MSFVSRKPFKPRAATPGRKINFRPRIGIRLWLTLLFLLITALAGVTAYAIVSPRLENTLRQASEASFSQVGIGFEDLVKSNPDLPPSRIEAYAVSRGVQWGIVRQDGEVLAGDPGDFSPAVVNGALSSGQPRQALEPIDSGFRRGQVLATYSAPINVPGETRTAVVFTKYITESDVENVQAAVSGINRVVALAGLLALLIAGAAGYAVADQISRRVSRLGVAAQRLAAGNFDERINTRVGDEVGDLGNTFNSMAASLKGAFRQIEQEKERGQAILDGMTDAVIGVDKDLNATFVNPRARELLETSDHAFHRRLEEILAKTQFEGALTAPEVHAGGQIFEVRTAPLEEGALAILRDVTEERQVERAKAGFIANASHELKTPLFALSGYLEILEDEEDEDVRRAFLQDMKAQTQRLQNLAKTLLDLSRLDANAVTFMSEYVDLEELLYEVRAMFHYANRQINVEAQENLPSVKTDPIQLQRVLSILLDNAIKYSPGDTPIVLRLFEQGDTIIIQVIDQGCGIPEQDIPYIFNRFYRAEGSSRADGTGLGLALAQEISHHIGVEILVESKPGEGSSFSVVWSSKSS